MSQDAIHQFRESFRLLDRDNDGFISKEDFVEVFSALGQSVTDTEVSDLMKQITQDGNSIDFTEFLTTVAKPTSDNNFRDEYLASFKLFDRNGDGIISADELQEGLRNMGENLSEDEINELLFESSNAGGIDFKAYVKLMSAKP